MPEGSDALDPVATDPVQSSVSAEPLPRATRSCRSRTTTTRMSTTATSAPWKASRELTAGVDGRRVTYGFGELDRLVLAYAATIHKSQGSEYPAVVIPVLTQHYAMLQRNLLYTGITRGKRLVGQRKAVALAVKNVSGRQRWSKLDEWLGHWHDSELTDSGPNPEATH